MKLSILIVNWRSKDYLRECLLSIRRDASVASPQIVVVDGGSFDGCGEMLAREFPEVDFVQSELNLGFGRSNNLGFARVTGDALLLLNPDTELPVGTLGALLRGLENLPSAGLVAPRLLNTDGSLQRSCVQAFPTPLNQFLDFDFLHRLFPQSRLWGNGHAFCSDEPVVVEAVSGACMLLRSETFRKVGGFSPEYFMYGEDMDLCAKVESLGLRVYHIPGVSLVHYGGGSTAEDQSARSAQTMRVSIHLFIRKTRGPSAAALYRALMGVAAIGRLLLLLPKSLLGGGSHQIRKWTAILRWALGTAGRFVASEQVAIDRVSAPGSAGGSL